MLPDTYCAATCLPFPYTSARDPACERCLVYLHHRASKCIQLYMPAFQIRALASADPKGLSQCRYAADAPLVDLGDDQPFRIERVCDVPFPWRDSWMPRELELTLRDIVRSESCGSPTAIRNRYTHILERAPARIEEER